MVIYTICPNIENVVQHYALIIDISVVYVTHRYIPQALLAVSKPYDTDTGLVGESIHKLADTGLVCETVFFLSRCCILASYWQHELRNNMSTNPMTWCIWSA